MKRKILMALMVLFLAISSFGNSAFALAPLEEQESKQDCNCGDVIEKPEGITELQQRDIAKSMGTINSNKDFREARKWFKKEGLKIDNENIAGLHMDELKTNNGESYTDVKHIAFNALSEDGKDRGILVAIVDNETNELLKVKADVFYNVTKDSFSHMQTYTSDKGFSDLVTKKELDSQVKVQFSPCVHVSVWLCIYHCGIWTVATGGAGGVVCGALCAYAFAYACS